MQAAYELLAPLDPGPQQRVMAWLSAALADTDSAPTAVDEPAAAVSPVADVPAEVAHAGSGAEVMAEHEAAVTEAETAASAVGVTQLAAAAEPEAAVEPEPEPLRDPRPRRGRSTKATSRRAAKPASSAAAKPAAAVTPAEPAPGPRSDRPGGEQFLADLAAVGSFKALAEKYGKSIGTIGNWANQLREQGFDIPVGRQRKA